MFLCRFQDAKYCYGILHSPPTQFPLLKDWWTQLVKNLSWISQVSFLEEDYNFCLWQPEFLFSAVRIIKYKAGWSVNSAKIK